MRHVQGIQIEREDLSHLVFMKFVLRFLFCSIREGSHIKYILHLKNMAIGMDFNEKESTLLTLGLVEDQGIDFCKIFPFQHKDLNEGLKYLGFNIKPNYYEKDVWWWLVSKID